MTFSKNSLKKGVLLTSMFLSGLMVSGLADAGTKFWAHICFDSLPNGTEYQNVTYTVNGVSKSFPVKTSPNLYPLANSSCQNNAAFLLEFPNDNFGVTGKGFVVPVTVTMTSTRTGMGSFKLPGQRHVVNFIAGGGADAGGWYNLAPKGAGNLKFIIRTPSSGIPGLASFPESSFVAD